MAQGRRVLFPEHTVVVLEVFDAGGNVSQAARAAGLSHGAARRIVEQAGRIGPPRRRSKPEAKAAVLAAVAEGVAVRDAARSAGVAVNTARDWVQGVRKSNGARIYPDGRTTPASGRYCWSVPKKMITDGRASLRMSGGRYLGLDERLYIAQQHLAGVSMTAIGTALGRSTSTISREVKLNTDPGTGVYGPHRAHQAAAVTRLRPRGHKLDTCPKLRAAVITMLGRKLSPEQVSGRLRVEYPDDEQMRISHESIYQALYVQAKGGFKAEVAQALRQGRLKRRPQGRVPHPRFKDPMVMISERPAVIEDRAVPGHWEGDLIIGAHGHSAIATVVERNTRFAVLVHLPDRRRDAATVGACVSAAMLSFPQQLRSSLTWDQGSEMAHHTTVAATTGMDVYFCDPASPWQRGTNENTNGLLRQYFPKGTDLNTHTPEHLAAVAVELNDRPRKTLGYLTPAEAMTKLIQNTGDATTT